MKFKRTLGLVLAVLMVLSSFTFNVFAATQNVQPTKTTNVVYGTPAIDGTITGAEWDNAEKVDFPYDRNNCSASNLAKAAEYAEGKEPYAMTMWDEDYLYVYYRVYDDAIITTGSSKVYYTDSVELYIDEFNDKGNTTGECTRFYQITARADGAAFTPADYSTDNFKTNINTAEGYYEVEMRYAWKSLVPSTDDIIGIDFAINNTDVEGDSRDNSFSWNDQTNDLWKAPVYSGNGVLVGGSSVVKYSVNYDANGGENAPASQTKEENVDLTLSSDVPVRFGYAFKGWATTAGGEVEYGAGAAYTANADVTLYAVWEYTFDESVNFVPDANSVLGEGWVLNTSLEETVIKWQVYTEGEDKVLYFSMWPAAEGKVSTTTLYAVKPEDGNIVGWQGGSLTAWGKEYSTSVTKAVVGEGITAIEGGFIEGYQALKTIEIPTTLTTLTKGQTFSASKFNCIYINGNEPVPGLVDVSNITSINGGYTFDSSGYFTSVKLSDDLTGQIRNETFKYTSLNEITFPAGVTSIRDEALENMSNLTKVTILGMETTIFRYAFASVPDPSSDNFKDNSSNVTIYCYEGSAAEANCKEYGFKYELLDGTPDPEPVATFTVTYDANGGANAPAAQTKEEGVDLTLSTSVPTRAAYAFKGWATEAEGAVVYAAGATYTADADVILYAVWELDIDEEARELPADATLLTEGWVPNSNLEETQIKWQAYTQGDDTVLKFTYWPELTDKTPTSVIFSVKTTDGKSIGYGNGQDLAWGAYEEIATKAIIGEGITGINGSAFMTFSKIKTIEIPTTLVSVTGTAFEGCVSLSSVYYTGNDPVPGFADFSTIPTLSSYVLDGCEALKVVKLNPNYSGAIGIETFKATAITEIDIPASVTEIKAEAFAKCKSLTKVIINGMGTTISPDAFKDLGKDTVLEDVTANVTIYGYEGSAAQANAEEYGFNFELIGSTPTPDPDPDPEPEPDENIVTGHAMAYYGGSVMADIDWTLNRTTGLLTLKSNIKSGHAESGAQNSEGGWKEYLSEIKEVVIEGNVGKITGHAFNGATNLVKVTMPAVKQIDGGAFYGCTNLKTVAITGNPVIEGVLDFSSVEAANAAGGSSFAKADVFNGSTKATGIILNKVYSDVIAEGQTSAPELQLGNLPDNIKVIYGATEYLEGFAADNGLEFVPFGKSVGSNFYWTIEDGVMTLIGEGALTGLDSAVEAYAADVTEVIIPDTVNEIADGALAVLTNLVSATFNGNAPAVADGAKPFGEQSDDFVITVKATATGFDGETWCGYALYKITFVPGDINEDGKINTADAVLLAQFIANWTVTINELAADVTGDGQINTADAVLLAQYLADWKVELVGPSVNSGTAEA